MKDATDDVMSAIAELEQLEKATQAQRAVLKLRAAKSRGPVTLELSDPITVDGEARTQLSVRPHTVKDIKLADEDSEGFAVRLAGMLTALTPDQVGLLSMTDFNALQAILEGFQMRRGVGSPAR